ncbi:MAG: RtcB family protein [Ferruginibacter sp.]|nr:RtcB family protein [Cytophagales bacterium]
METHSLTGKDLLEIGFPQGKAMGIALQILQQAYAGITREEKLALLKSLLAEPATAAVALRPVVEALVGKPDTTVELVTEDRPFAIYGAEGIQEGALKQMRTAMKLPVTVAGALMADAHQGYGLPIGGVLATRNAVIPYGVGVDIGCRMCLTLYELPVDLLEAQKGRFKKLLMDNTRFGRATFQKPKDHEVLERTEFRDIKVVRELKDRAAAQIGSSGGGNHFVEFGVVEIRTPIPECGLAPGRYLAVLSHSGSRGMGATIAGHYTKMAMEQCKLPAEARHLAWLDLATEAGQEYWRAMNLAGDYASACHHQIHERLSAALGETPLARIENHHNFAWREKDAAGDEIIVHRKGATPAGQGVLGIIPGSMATPGFLVRGKGLADSINSASHGAGRVMSRTMAKNTLTQEQVVDYLARAGVEVIGSGLDEAPMVYKDIHRVMAHQQELVEVLGSFTPYLVRMCGDEHFAEAD